mgnify:CR=1 FL=1|jgi:hypothetical protein
MKSSLAALLLALGLCGQARAQLQAQPNLQPSAQDGEDRERTRREMREVMRSERERWRENSPPVQGWAWRPPAPRHWEGHEGRLTPKERRELRNLLEETARERRALAAERGAELVPAAKGAER